MKYPVRRWDSVLQAQVNTEMTYEEIIANPFGLYVNDIAFVLLAVARKQRNLSPTLGNAQLLFGEPQWTITKP